MITAIGQVTVGLTLRRVSGIFNYKYNNLNKQLLSCVHMSKSTKEMDKYGPTVVNISPVLRLHKFNKDNENAPLTLLFPWATATERALDRFRTLYAERGFNVLTAYAKPINFLWPRSAQPVAAEVTEYLRTKTGTGPIVVHAFSIGAFIYANLLAWVTDGRHDQELAELKPRICGQVFDSLVIGTLKEMRIGTAKMLTQRWFLQQLISTMAAVYHFLTHSNTVAIYDQMVDIYWKNPFETSILCYYSLIDTMCKTESMEQFIASWEERTGQPAHHRCFPDTQHAEILRAKPEEYRDTLFKYLDTLQLEQKGSPAHSKL